MNWKEEDYIQAVDAPPRERRVPLGSTLLLIALVAALVAFGGVRLFDGLPHPQVASSTHHAD